MLATATRLLPNPFGHLFLGQAELGHQRFVGRRLLQGVQVGPLDVLDQGQFKQVLGLASLIMTGTSVRTGQPCGRQRRSPAMMM